MESIGRLFPAKVSFDDAADEDDVDDATDNDVVPVALTTSSATLVRLSSWIGTLKTVRQMAKRRFKNGQTIIQQDWPCAKLYWNENF